MRPVTLFALGLVGLLASEAVEAQSPRRLGFQASVGLALRDLPTPSFAAGEGAHGVGRVLIPLRSHFRVVSEVSLTRFPTRHVALPVPGPCPNGTLCPLQVTTAPGLHITSLSIGLQRRFTAAPMDLELSALAGGSWFSRRAPGADRAAVSLGGAVSLLFPGSQHVRPLLEARALRLLTTASNPRWVGGVALGVAVE
jgi:hypothetical protein